MNKNVRNAESTVYHIIENERNYRHHLTRLGKISTDKKIPVKQKALWEHDALLKRGQDSLRRKQTQRLIDIQKDNERILTNLLKITQRNERKPPQSQSQSQPKFAKPAAPAPINNNNGRIKSMNQTTRKNEILKILNENVKITGRLIFQDSKFSKDKMEKDFKQHQQYSNRIRKVRVGTDKTFAVGHGTIKMSKDMRIVSHGAYLPPLKAGFPGHYDPSLSHRSLSAPKLQLNHLAHSERNHRSPTRDMPKGYSISHRPSDSGSDLATQGTFVSQLDYRNHSIPIHKAQELQAQSGHIGTTMSEMNVQGYQSERYERNYDREPESAPYTQRTYIASFPIEEAAPQEAEHKEAEFVNVKEVSQTYEESQRDIRDIGVEDQGAVLERELTVEERSRITEKSREQGSEEEKVTKRTNPSVEKLEEKEEKSRLKTNDSKEKLEEIEVKEDSIEEIPDDEEL